jgi:hypothetical protein
MVEKSDPCRKLRFHTVLRPELVFKIQRLERLFGQFRGPARLEIAGLVQRGLPVRQR